MTSIRMKKKLGKNIIDFLKEFKVITVAIGFIMAQAISNLVTSFVENIFMPLLDPLIPNATWETATLSLGPVNLGWGLFLSSVLRFAILFLIIYFVIKKLLKYKPTP